MEHAVSKSFEEVNPSEETNNGIVHDPMYFATPYGNNSAS
ncbi:hypothetical protein YWY31_28670 [Paenibacillus illinoisensis]